MLKRIISLYLCAALVFSLLPAQVFATEEMPEPTESATEPVEETVVPTEEEPTEEVTESTEEVTEPTEEMTEPAEAETEATEAATVPEEEPELVFLEAQGIDSEELLMGYLSPFYTSGEGSFFGTMARDRLSPANQHLYDGLKALVVQLAKGEKNNTSIDVSFEDSGYSPVDADMTLVQEALLFDYPFEMYWYYGCYSGRGSNFYRVIMVPNPYYQADGFDHNSSPYIDTDKTKKASAAAENIYTIKTRYEASSDYDKLSAYVDEICALVEYDTEAAKNSETLYPTDNRPWTLINVFDNDPATNVVCEGYSEAFQYLCDESTFRGDVVCFSVTGDIPGGGHKWNIVRIEGISYLMDVTNYDYNHITDRSYLFLSGGTGSVAAGYTVDGILYTYHDKTMNIYGSGEDSVLKLSPTKYTPPATYTILYDANGGTNAPNSQKKTQGKDLTLRQEIPAWSGHIFQGWATTSAATAAEYQPGDVYSAEGDAVLYAVWALTECKHSFIDAICEYCGLIGGTCGENLVWTLDANGTLIVSGSGAMEDNYYRTDIPWYDYIEQIKTVEIKSGVTSFNIDTISICGNLSGIRVDGNNVYYSSDDFGILYNKNKTVLLRAPRRISASYTIPASVRSIGDKAFSGCDCLESIIISNGVTRIGDSSFDGCINLTNISLPDSVIEIGIGAFSRCIGITSMIIPDNVTKIDIEAFRGCSSLTSITIPANVTNVGICAFEECSKLTGIWVDENNSSYCSDINGVLFNKNKTELLAVPGGITGSYSIPDSVTQIGDYAFSNCGGLQNITLSDGITHIGRAAFAGCSGLTEMVLPDSLATISGSAFYGCLNLADITLPQSITYVDEGVFSGCSSLENIVLPNCVTEIGWGAFSDCTSLISIKLPSSIKSIDDRAFAGCVSLKEIVFEGGVPAFTFDIPEPFPQISDAFDSVSATVYYPANNPTWTSDVMQNYGGTITWVPYGGVENQVLIPAADLGSQTSVWIDGREYAVKTDSGMPYVDLPDGNAKTMVVHSYGVSNGRQYPLGMKVWMLSNEDGFYTATRVQELDDVLGYEGCSIRVTGTQGIRMITSLDKADKAALTGDGLAGYTLKEYGTAIAWASQLGSRRPLTLGNSYVSANYAYSREAGTDPVFATTDSRTQYTNVVVGYNLDQCKNDIAMRPYMILSDASGNEITLYGGIVERSIGYIAAQNADTFNEETEADAYKYVWNIIRHVYGEDYIPE